MKQLAMLRGDMPAPYTVPDGLTLRNARPGEELLWVEACLGEFAITQISMVNWEKRMKTALLENVFFLMDRDDRPAATATALLRPRPDLGNLHYVAVRPEWRGRGLGNVVVCAVIERLRALGRPLCYLTTDDNRIPAVRSYLKLGYIPVLDHEEARPRWEAVLREIGRTGVACVDAEFRPLPDITVRGA